MWQHEDLTKRSTSGRGEIIVVPHPTEPTVLEWLDTLQARSKEFAFGVGLCERKIIERRTEAISLAWFSPFFHLDEPYQGNKRGIEISATLLIHRRQWSSAKRQHSSNATVWQNARWKFSTLEISKVAEISKTPFISLAAFCY